jgi:hypothetical protein
LHFIERGQLNKMGAEKHELAEEPSNPQLMISEIRCDSLGKSGH